jgi:hypothetical protein
MICACGYEYPDALGKYGCPNCEGSPPPRARTRKCPICRTPFVPERQGQKCCKDPDCAVTLGRQIKEKAQRAADRKKRLEQKTNKSLADDLQAVFNLFIRTRDADLPCISCGRTKVRQWHAGHLKTRGAHPELAIHEWNVNKQCSQCNDHMSGNVEAHRQGIKERYGQERLDWLDGPHPAEHYTREDLINLRQFYRDKVKMLKMQRGENN